MAISCFVGQTLRDVYPQADVQHCIVHKVRSTFPKIRVQDKTEFIGDLKTIYNALDRDLALAAFDTVQAKWGKKYPKPTLNLRVRQQGFRSWRFNIPEVEESCTKTAYYDSSTFKAVHLTALAPILDHIKME